MMGKLGKYEVNTIVTGDCLDVMAAMPDGCVDLIFADPPFNLKKDYGDSVNDCLPTNVYLDWCYSWLQEYARLCKDGGSIIIHNLPKWAICLGHYMFQCLGLTFQNWIVWRTWSWPAPNNLYPSHYAFLYFTKGGTKTLNIDKVKEPHSRCPHCKNYLAQWGGREKYRNPEGKRVSDVWIDIYRCRHQSVKHREANELPELLMERIIRLFSNSGDLVADFFMGSGMTAVIADRLGRKWFGCDINPGCVDIVLKRVAKDRLERSQTKMAI